MWNNIHTVFIKRHYPDIYIPLDVLNETSTSRIDPYYNWGNLLCCNGDNIIYGWNNAITFTSNNNIIHTPCEYIHTLCSSPSNNMYLAMSFTSCSLVTYDKVIMSFKCKGINPLGGLAYDSGDCVFISKEGHIYTWQQGKTPLLLSCIDEVICPSPLYILNHPQTLSLATNKYIRLYDLRVKNGNGNILLNSPEQLDVSCYLKSWNICVSSSHNMILLDIRYPNKPLNTMTHIHENNVLLKRDNNILGIDTRDGTMVTWELHNIIKRTSGCIKLPSTRIYGINIMSDPLNIITLNSKAKLNYHKISKDHMSIDSETCDTPISEINNIKNHININLQQVLNLKVTNTKENERIEYNTIISFLSEPKTVEQLRFEYVKIPITELIKTIQDLEERKLIKHIILYIVCDCYLHIGTIFTCKGHGNIIFMKVVEESNEHNVEVPSDSGWRDDGEILQTLNKSWNIL